MIEKTVLKYETILQELRLRIVNGEFTTSGRLPIGEELADFYNCSRPTIKKVLNELQEDGLIVTKKGSGTYLSPNKNQMSISEKKQNPSNLLFGLLFQNNGPSFIFDTLCNQLTQIVAEKGYSIVYGGYISIESPDFLTQVEHFVKRLISLKVNGVFFAPFEYCKNRDDLNHYVLNQLSEAHVSVVLIDTDVDDFPKRSDFDLVSLDHIQAGYVLANHLITCGVRQIIFIAPPNSSHTIKLRAIGFSSALFDHDIPLSKANFVELDPENKNEVQTCMASMKPEAIVCSNDVCAINLMESLRELGYRIPEDALICGFDNTNAITKTKVPLTSIRQPLSEITREAVRTMFRRIKSPDAAYTTIRLEGELVIRKSTTR